MLDAQTSLVEAADSFLDRDVRLARIGLCHLVDTERLERVLSRYRETNGNVRVVLDQLEGVDARTALQGGQFDFMVGPAEHRLPTIERSRLYEDVLVYLPAGRVGPPGKQRSAVHVGEIAGDEFLLVHETCGLTLATRRLFRSRRLPLNQYAGQAVSYQVLEEWARVGVGSAILPRSKLSSPDIGHPIVLGNGHPAMIRFEALWSSVTTRPPHLQALVQHFQHAGEALATRPPARR